MYLHMKANVELAAGTLSPAARAFATLTPAVRV
jgi:hypothetical protein